MKKKSQKYKKQKNLKKQHRKAVQNMKNYKIDFEKQTLTITKEFAERARNINSEEYSILMRVKSDFPDMRILKYTHKSPKKASGNKSISYKKMESYMKLFDNADELLKMFELVKRASLSQKNSYMFVKKWFLSTFPDFFEVPAMENGKLIALLPLHSSDNKKEGEYVMCAMLKNIDKDGAA